MQMQPLTKEIHARALELGVQKIYLSFSGGSDEGYLDVNCTPCNDENKTDVYNFCQQIEEWAWDNYSYNGAGDGTDYGDEVIYHLDENKVSHQSWEHVVHHNEVEFGALAVE